jgi:RNA polymerase II subunit A small phosphatase-like protein
MKSINSSNNLVGKYLLPQKQLKHQGKKTLVLDLDETLIHSNFEEFPNGSNIKISVKIDAMIYKIFAVKRPGVEEFLERMSKLYEVVIYTASLQQVSFSSENNNKIQIF